MEALAALAVGRQMEALALGAVYSNTGNLATP